MRRARPEAKYPRQRPSDSSGELQVEPCQLASLCAHREPVKVALALAAGDVPVDARRRPTDNEEAAADGAADVVDAEVDHRHALARQIGRGDADHEFVT